MSLPPRARARHAARRAALMRQLGAGVLVLPTAPQQIRNADTHHPYRAGSEFWYLTGFAEPEAVLVLRARPRGQPEMTLFVRPRDPERETWDGRRAGVAGAKRGYGAAQAYPIAELGKHLPELLRGAERLFFTLGRDSRTERILLDALARNAASLRRSAPPAHPPLFDPSPVLAAMRVRKDPDELALLGHAADVTALGHLQAMQAARPGMYEYQVQAVLEAAFLASGSPRLGYQSIVASGPNACILHYHENDRRLRAGELLLIDAGAEVGMYTADVTRTFPVGERFSEPQRAVYAVVLRAQKAAIRAARAGRAWNAPHRTAVRTLTRGLVELGVLRGRVHELVRSEAYKPYYMHGTSHWLGLDVHDAGAYSAENGAPVRLQPGHVLTVEPGLYFDPRLRGVPRALRGIGIRIEDDVAVTRGAPRVLTAAAPKEIAEIEAIRANARS